ncbi:MAG: phenylalanine--tRNA ligase beta subunit-related protein [Nitrososphaerota archaeon]|nr:phenylalanine--tRNA ligase beta subunit-related protein [Nitrososphaerota archaeon]
MRIILEQDIISKFPDLKVLIQPIRGLKVERSNPQLEEFKEQVYKRVKEEYTLEGLKDIKIFRLYRDFFWKIGIDPTKIRPAAEALIRRILGGKGIPQINTVVDTYNLVSINTGIALAAFDMSKLKGDLRMRFARPNERFLGIGMDQPMVLKGCEVVVTDEDNLIAIYPYRDADFSKVTEETRDVLFMVCGVPGIDEEKLEGARRLVFDYINKFCRRVE